MLLSGTSPSHAQICARIALFVALVTVAFSRSPAADDLHDPESERTSFTLLEGFEVNLFAAEPMLAKPIHMTWDPQGRLWVACSQTYPQVTPGQAPNDKVYVLEDTDCDGRADKSTVFADGLYVPTGIELGDGGLYVANAPDLLFLRDTDGDLRADERRVVLSGFGTEDNHHSISAWRWGPSGWLYFQEGTFLHAQVETPHGVVRLENGGVFQFRPRSLELGVFADYRASNPWGHMFDRWGQSILIDNPQIYYLTPATANSRAKLEYKSMFQESTKLCGGEFVSGRHLPEEFRGELWSNAYKAHALYRYRLSDAGSGYIVEPRPPLLTSTSDYFRPVELKVGPDGAVYVADWYNLIIGHMQYEFRDPRRDKEHGRIWRITYKGRPLVERPEIADRATPDVLDGLKSDEDWTRHQTKRSLYDRDASETGEALRAWVAALDMSDPDFEHHRLEALWTFQTIGVVEPDLLRAVLNSPDGRARAMAVRALRDWHASFDDSIELLAAAALDPHPRVRLEAVLSLSFIPKAESVVAAMRALEKPQDRFIDQALRLAVDGLRPHWLVDYRAGNLQFATDAERDFALAHANSIDALAPLLTMLNSTEVDAARLDTLLAAVADHATPRDLEPLWTRMSGVTSGGLSDETVVRLLAAFAHAAKRGVQPATSLKGVSRYVSSANPRVQEMAIRLAAAWNQRSEARPIMRFVKTHDAPIGVRVAAAEAIARWGGKDADELAELAETAHDLSVRYVAIAGLATFQPDRAATSAARVLALDPSGEDAMIVMTPFLQRPAAAAALARSMGNGVPHSAVAERVRGYLNETGIDRPELGELFRDREATNDLEAQLLAEGSAKLAAAARELGDATRGESLFRSAKLACTKCHAVGPAGPDFGPELAALGASSPPDYVVDSILEPSKTIKDQYGGTLIATVDGRTLSGIVAFQDSVQVVLRDATRQGEKTTLALSEIDEMLPTTKSLMPSGIASQLRSRQDFLDLAKFLMELGRPGAYSVSHAPIVRRWRLADGATGESVGDAETPAYSMVDGRLPAQELRSLMASKVAASFELEVATSGRVVLEFNAGLGISAARINGRAVDVRKLPTSPRLPIDLDLGHATITLTIDVAERGAEPLRCEVVVPESSNARFQLVGGV